LLTSHWNHSLWAFSSHPVEVWNNPWNIFCHRFFMLSSFLKISNRHTASTLNTTTCNNLNSRAEWTVSGNLYGELFFCLREWKYSNVDRGTVRRGGIRTQWQRLVGNFTMAGWCSVFKLHANQPK
jgi:hypothetical protein